MDRRASPPPVGVRVMVAPSELPPAASAGIVTVAVKAAKSPGRTAMVVSDSAVSQVLPVTARSKLASAASRLKTVKV